MSLNKKNQITLFSLILMSNISSAQTSSQQRQDSPVDIVTITVTGEQPVFGSDGDYETIELASIPATLPGHQRGPVDSGTWLDQDHLTGDWNGLRSQLSDQGITIESSLVADWSRNLKGGKNTHGEAFRHLFDFNMTFDLEKLLGLEASRFFVDFQTHDGQNGSDEVGDIQGFSNIDEQGLTVLYEAWYEQWLVEKTLRIKIGKVDANGEFAYVENGGEFIHSSPGFSPSISPLPTYPNPAMSINLFLYPSEHYRLALAVYDGSTQEGFKTGRRGPSTFFRSDPSDLFLIGEVGMTWDEDNLPGRVGVGGWHHTGSFDKFDGGTESGTEGFYLVCDKALCKENPDDPEDEQGAGLFLQYGLSDEAVAEIEQHFGVGIQCVGALPARDEDITGIMASWADLSDKAGAGFTENAELAIELFHRFQLTPFFSLKPDVQYIINPGGSGTSDAIVATLRTELVF